MSEATRGSYDDALYKSTYTLLYLLSSMLWGTLSYFEKLTGEDLSRYLNKIESIC